MNTYQITAERRPGGQNAPWVREHVDAESLEEARARFREAYPAGEWLITWEELTDTDVPEGQTGREGRREALLAYVCDEVCRHRVPGRSQEELEGYCEACSLGALAEGAAATAEQAGNAGKGAEPPQKDREEASRQTQLRAMQLALSITFERTLKSDLFLWAAQRGREDFFLLDGNAGMMAESVLGQYQRILDEELRNPQEPGGAFYYGASAKELHRALKAARNREQ